MEIEMVRFICRTENGSVIVYVDLHDKTVFSGAYPNDFCTLKVKNFRKKLEITPSKEIIEFFRDVAEKNNVIVFQVKDGIVSVNLKDFEEFANAVWFTISRIKNKEKMILRR